jgi:hypothetical protein
MSSSYHALCLAHDPALHLGRELTRDEVDHLTNRALLGDSHQHCDIVIGRWSGGLAELGCPGTNLPGPRTCNGHHPDTAWTPIEWLRLLAAAAPLLPPKLHERFTARGCWPLDRLTRLRHELET